MKLALIGKKLTHSYSRIIHGIFFRLTGTEGSYDLVEIPSEDEIGVFFDVFESERSFLKYISSVFRRPSWVERFFITFFENVIFSLFTPLKSGAITPKLSK